MEEIKQPTIALAMIVRGADEEAEHLAECLASVSYAVDAIYINLNHPKGEKVSERIKALCAQYTKNVYETEWTGNFVKARNFIFSKVPDKYDWVMWLDADDTVDNPEKIRDLIAITSKSVKGIYIKYDYDHDKFGNCTVSHWVARVVQNDGSYAWKSSIDDDEVAVHETLNEVIPRPKVMSDDFKVIHHADPERREHSLERNIELLEGMYQRQQEKGNLDPRTLFYLATHYFDARKLNEAKQLFQDYLQLSGWAEERCEALVYLGQIYTMEGKEGQSKHAYLLAIGEYQNSPRPYIELSELEYRAKRYQNSADWIEKALKLPKPTTTMVQRPMDTTYRAYMLAAQAYANLGGKKLDEAAKYVHKALKLRPLDPDAQKGRDMIEELIEKREDIRAAMRLVRTFERKEQTDKIVPLLDDLPTEAQDNPLILNVRHNYTEPKKWPKKSIAIYAGQGPLGIWGPWSLGRGIGGSEEAVIRLSRELSELGWNVHIYATPGERMKETHGWDTYRPGRIALQEGGANDGEDYSAPAWHQYYEFNPKDEYDVLIGWRNPTFFDNDFKARKKYLWLHDLMDKEEFTPERLDNLDKVIFVSQYHAEEYKDVIPENKWFVSGNGVDPKEFEKSDGKFKRDPYKCIYMSAHNRGLKVLLDIWPEVKKAVPQATLEIAYGWHSYDAINKDNPERMAWKYAMVSQIKKLDGVTDLGKISQDDIVNLIQGAGIMAYPCIFPEVYCISLVKAQAGGAYPVTSDFAVVGDYNRLGTQVHYEVGEVDKFKEDYTKALITDLKRKAAIKDPSAIREQFSWKLTAEGWSKEMK